MSAVYKPTKAEIRLVDSLVETYEENRYLVEAMLKQVSTAMLGSPSLMSYVHSTKSRLKDPAHLRDSLFRKIDKAKKKNRPFAINNRNLFQKVNDLAGFRIIHLHTSQFIDIDRELRAVFTEYRYPLVETPGARVWDNEARAFYTNAGVKVHDSPTMYTSVHYVIESSNVTKATCEIQVRTLAEELWGEVDHSINYPHESKLATCREQIKVLARLTSGCTRLVDSIFSAARWAAESESAANSKATKGKAANGKGKRG